LNSIIGAVELGATIAPSTLNPASIIESAGTFLGSASEMVDQLSFTQFRNEEAVAEVKADTTGPPPVGDNRFDITRILSNPRVVKTGNLPTKSEVAADHKIDFGFNFFKQAPIANVIQNFVGINFTMCVNLKTNSDPYASGLFYLVFVPPGYTQRTGLLTTTGTTPFINIAAATFLPHAVVDLAECPNATLKIPFYFPTAFYETYGLDKPGILGEFLILPFAIGHKFGSSVKPEYTMFAWLEDVELRYPGDNTSVVNDPVYIDLVPQGPELKTHNPGTSVMVQSVASEPLDEIQGPPGFLKPYAPVPQQVVPDGACSNKFTDLFKQESYVGDIHWTDAQTYGSELGVILVRPQPSIISTVAVPDENNHFISAHARTALATHHFNLHNGTLHFRLKIIKTKFHSGRVQVCYTPNHLHDFTKLDWSKHWSTVLDVNDGSEFVISIKGTPATRAYYRTAVWGYLYFRTINRLNHPDVASSFCPILVYVSGDLQVASPRYTQAGDFDYLTDLSPSLSQVTNYKALNAQRAAEIKMEKEAPYERSVTVNSQGPVLSTAQAASHLAKDVAQVTAIADDAFGKTITYLESRYPQSSVPGSSSFGSSPTEILHVVAESVSRGPAKFTKVTMESPSPLPQALITDGVVLDPGFTTNNGGCDISKYMQCVSNVTNTFLKTRTIVLETSSSVYLEPLCLSHYGHGRTNAKGEVGPLNMIASMFLGTRSDVAFITRKGADFDGLFLTNQYNYGCKDYNYNGEDQKLFIPWDSNILYAPYRFRGQDLGKPVWTVLGSCPNFYGFFPWFPSLTKIINKF